MKKNVIILFFLCFVATTLWSAEDDHQFIPIAVLDNTIVTGQTHRAPVSIPIQAYFDGLFKSVYVNFLQDCGYVDVTITNLSTGYYVKYGVDSRKGGSFLPVSGEVGTYRIVLILANGLGYEGKFEIERI